MKKPVLIFISFIVLASAVQLKAADITAGATAWYSYWEMQDSTEDIEPGILYGPVFAVKFNEDFNLNFVFL